MIRLWSFPGSYILYRSRTAAAESAGNKPLISYTLEGQGVEVSTKDFYLAIDGRTGRAWDRLQLGAPFVHTHHTLLGDMYLLNSKIAHITETSMTNPTVTVFPTLYAAKRHAESLSDAHDEPYAVVSAERPFLGYDVNTHEVMRLDDLMKLPSYNRGQIIHVYGLPKVDADAPTGKYAIVR